jgi:general secretion pathway protein I
MPLEKNKAPLPTSLLDSRGFTLLEVLIAMAIMIVALASIFMIEGSSIGASDKAKRMNIVSMLAKNKMIETEFDLEGKGFDELDKETSGKFDPPFSDYGWKRSVKELKFPNIGSGGGSGQDDANAQVTALISKLFSEFLSKSIREVSVAITWQRGGHEQSFAVATYWVDLNHAFELTE